MMEHSTTIDAAVRVSLALAAGTTVQVLARHLRLPGIVLHLILVRNGKVHPVGSRRPFRKGDVVHFVVYLDEPAEVRRQMRARGWHLEQAHEKAD